MLSHHHYKDQSDEELISLYKKTDDLEIVGVLYDRYTALTFGVCLKYLKDREESRDAVAAGIASGWLNKLDVQRCRFVNRRVEDAATTLPPRST